MNGLTYDTGALIAAERRNDGMRDDLVVTSDAGGIVRLAAAIDMQVETQPI